MGAVYYPYIYRPDSRVFVAVRASAEADSMRLTLERTVREIDPELAVNEVRSMDERIRDSLVERRSPALLATLFAGVALLLTGIGTYGVLSYTVAQRRREIGVRMALGARPGQILGGFLALTLNLLVAGMLLGMVGAWIAGKAMQSVLFRVPAMDGWVMVSVSVVMAAVAIAACLAPARRASGVSPVEALAEG